MPVDTRHPEYDSAEQKWQRCRDASAGQWAVHAAGERYLPKLKDQTPQDYAAYKLRASYFNACGRTLDGLVGMVFRKSPAVEAAEAFLPVLADVDLKDTSADSLSETLVREVLQVGRAGCLVEFPRVTGEPVNAAAAASANLRPYVCLYKTESIINWRYARINNVMQLALVVLVESHNYSPDGYEQQTMPQIRVLRLGQNALLGNRLTYLQEVWRKSEDGSDWMLVDVIEPLMSGHPLDFIPFYPFGADGNSLDIGDAPLLDLADLNLAHYRVTADYEHGCHFTGLPMLFLAGVTLGENEKVYLGSQTAVVTADPNADGKFIEFSGQGMGALEKNLDRKEKQLAVLGARMLEQQKAGVESEGAMAMRSNGESSVLATLANMVSDGMSKMLTFMAAWSGISQPVSFRLNTDYLPAGLNAQDLAALVQAWQTGAISFDTLFWNLKQGEVIAPEVTLEDERDRIESSGMALVGDGNGE